MIERILFLMDKEGIKPKELIIKLGLNHSAITDWKNGKAKPGTEAIIKIAEYFNVSTDYLLGQTDDPNKPLSESEPLEIPEILKNKKIAASGGEDNWNQDEINRIAEFAAFIKSQKK